MWYLYVIGFIGSAYFGCIFPAFSYFLSQIIVILSKVSETGEPEYQKEVNRLSFLLLIVSLGALILTSVKGVCFTILNERIGVKVKEKAFKKAMEKDLQEIEAAGAQSYSHTITINCDELKPLAGNFLPHIVENSITVLVGLTIALVFSWQITLMSLVIFPLILLSSKIQMSFNHGMQNTTDSVHKQNHEMVVTAVMNIKTVKSLHLESKLTEVYSRSHEEALALAMKYGNIVGIMFGVGQTLISCLLASIFFVGALLIREGAVEIVDVYTAIYAIMFSGVQAGGNLFFLSKLSVAKYSACKYFQLTASSLGDGEMLMVESESE